MRYLWFNVMVFCFVRALLGVPIDRLARWIAKDRRIIDEPLPPKHYQLGTWM